MKVVSTLIWFLGAVLAGMDANLDFKNDRKFMGSLWVVICIACVIIGSVLSLWLYCGGGIGKL